MHSVGLHQGTERREVKECKCCGTHHRFHKEDCPAYGKTCLNCSRKNHFQRKCTLVGTGVNAVTNSTDSHLQVHQVANVTSSSDEEWLNTVGCGGKHLKCRIFVGRKVTFQTGMGSSVNMLPARLAEKTEPTDKVLKMWKHTHLSPFRKSRQSVLKSNNGKVYIFDFTAFEENFACWV